MSPVKEIVKEDEEDEENKKDGGLRGFIYLCSSNLAVDLAPRKSARSYDSYARSSS